MIDPQKELTKKRVVTGSFVVKECAVLKQRDFCADRIIKAGPFRPLRAKTDLI